MKNLKLVFSITLICLVFMFLGAVAPNFILHADVDEILGSGTQNNPYLIQTIYDGDGGVITSAEEFLNYFGERINLNEGNYPSAYYKLMENVEITGSWSPIGTDENPFRGVFDGNGKTIKVGGRISSSIINTNIGLFGVTNGAEVKNLGVESTVILEDEGMVLSLLKIGGVVGKALTSRIFNCKVDFRLSAERIEGEDITSKYAGEINAGGVLGYGEATEVYNCSVAARIKIYQDGTNIVNSNFGGVAGQMNNGKVYSNYVAPSYSGSENLVSKIGQKGGVLTALEAESCDVVIVSVKTTDSKVAFGGIIGYARGASLDIYNNVYASLISSITPAKLIYGGIIGRVSSNPIDHPTLRYSKYLNITNSANLSFSSAVGNAAAVSYVVNANNSNFRNMPTQSFYTSSEWLEDWNFDTVWKNASIISYGGYFFPNLQVFSTFNVRLSSNYTVEYNTQGEYVSGFISFYFLNSSGDPIWRDEENNIYETEINFDAGAQVRIKAEFYSESGNPMRNFQHYYEFTSWALGGNAVVSSQNGSSANGYTTSASNSRESIVSFTASASREGIYSVNIQGKPVTVEVYLMVQDGTGSESNFGSVNQMIGNQVINKTQNFTINTNRYQGGVATVLEAVNMHNSGYVFYRWVDYNSPTNIVQTKMITFELDNTRTSTLTRNYPRVIYDEEKGKLVTQLICYYSNNTSPLTLNISGSGSVTIDGGEAIITETHNENLVNGKLTTLVAAPGEGYSFVGWYVENVLVSSDVQYMTSINTAKTIEARFQLGGPGIDGGLPGWAIALIVIGSVAVAGGIVLIIIKIKRNSSQGYKKNYRY